MSVWPEYEPISQPGRGVSEDNLYKLQYLQRQVLTNLSIEILMSTFLNISNVQKVVPSPTAQHYVVILEGDVPHRTSAKDNFLVIDGTIPSKYKQWDSDICKT